jgi:class 3 adenylate cyclase/predicted ATPase
MDVEGWLRSLGLEEYEAVLRQNKIDSDVFSELTEGDLEKLGIPLGDRKRLLRAIRSLEAQKSSSASSLPPVVLGEMTVSRRQLTVMFCDLIGSTALSARLDPEDMREIVGAYHRRCADLINQAGGFVAKYMGDGVLAYFGYPLAHEHDAEQAVRAGLAVVDAVPKLKTEAGIPLQVRVGIATGLVVVGDLLGSGEAQERGVVGETPNLAARLQGIAQPNTVILADATQRLLGNLFELEDLGARDIKGIAGTVRAWAALRASSVESRFDALHTTSLTALVGRDEEVELLLRRWSSAKKGQGHVVLLSGEAGIGKSRLTAALLERLAADPHTRLRYFCSPQRADSALHPIIGQMERAAGLAYDDEPQAKLDKLDAVLAQTSTTPQDAALFAEMLSLANDGRYPTLDLVPEQRRQRTLEALSAQLARLARQKPVLMIVEDAHWVDPTSLEVLDRAVNRISSLRVLLIITFRPEFTAPWVGHSHVTSLTLSRLGKREAADIVAHLVGNKELPADAVAEIVERTDGIPLFVEEMTKAVLEAESGAASRQTIARVPPLTLIVPASLYASLMARLDRLGTAKDVAQIGAAIGREFSHMLLALVARWPEAELRLALDRLIQAGLLFRQGMSPNASYLFKHALVQDIAYGTLLRDQRRALHTRIAETLEGQFAETAESQPEILARHYTEAGLLEKGAGLWGKAGQQSLARSALVEAAAQLTRALEQIESLPITTSLRRQQMEFQVALITPLIHVKGHAAVETKAALEKARLLIDQAESVGEPAQDQLLLFSVLYGFWVANYVAFNGAVICDHAAQFLALAEKQGTKFPLMFGHRLMGASLLFTGEIPEGQAHLEEAIALYEPAEHRLLAMRFGQDAEVAILSDRSWARWLHGYPEAALRDADDALSKAREMGQAATLMYALSRAPTFSILRGDHAEAAAQAEELLTLANEKGSAIWKARSLVYEGGALALSGSARNAIQMISTGIAASRSTGATFLLPFYLLCLARAHAELRQFEEASRCIGEAMTVAATTNEKWCEAEIYRAAGEITLISPRSDAAKAQANFERALAISRYQKARSWELRTATSMASLWRDQRKWQQAYDLLAPIYSSFTEGFGTPDLKQAKALLDEFA